MCGRFAIVESVPELLEAFELAAGPNSLAARYNVAPTQLAPVIPNRQPRQLELFRWGLVPGWAKDVRIGAKMINARSETAAEKPSFKTALARRRCLVPASGFYEWKKTAGAKVPHFIRHKSGRPLALAGLWELWDKGPEPVYSFTILTTEPNQLVARLHNRMPVILPAAAWSDWLNPAPVEPQALQALLAAYPADEMEAYPVSTQVNSPANDRPELIEPV
jgi:putative SOS response-associated peptidase YedK